MNKDKIRYILNHYSSLMTRKESLAWKHWSSTYKMKDCSPEQRKNRTKVSLRTGWMTKDLEILELLENGIADFEKNVAIRIDNKNSIEYNICPRCIKLTRTPKAKQCRYCGHSWH